MAKMAFGKLNWRVRDIDAAVDYARDVLGGEVVSARHTTDLGEIAVVRVGGLTMELISPTDPNSPLGQIMERRGEGIDAVGFYTDDVAGAAAELEQRGARIVKPVARLGWIHPKNPLSVSIELVPRSAAAE